MKFYEAHFPSCRYRDLGRSCFCAAVIAIRVGSNRLRKFASGPAPPASSSLCKKPFKSSDLEEIGDVLIDSQRSLCPTAVPPSESIPTPVGVNNPGALQRLDRQI